MVIKKTQISLLFLLTLSFFSNSAFAQSRTDSIHVKQMLGPVFSKNGEVLRPKELLEITKSNPEAYKAMKKAKTNNDVGSVIGGIGGALVGFPLGTAVAGGKANWTVAAVGAGLIAVSIPFIIGYAKNARKAVNIYNSDLAQSQLAKPELKFGLNSYGIGVKVTF